MATYRDSMQTFEVDSLPDLDVVTLAALELFSDIELPSINTHQFKRPLVVGSVNGAAVGKLLFADTDAVFADESSYKEKIDSCQDIDGAFLISASGAKHAIPIAQELKSRSVPVVLLTNNAQAPAKEYIPEEQVLVFPKNREPYTYNTSTYMSFLLSKTKEDPAAIFSFIKENVEPILPENFTDYKAFCLIIPPHYTAMREMFATKFDELFGPELVGRIFTSEQMKHAKTVIYSDAEYFISFGEGNTRFGNPNNRLNIPLPKSADYAAMMAIGYFVIGTIQKQFPPFFKQNIVRYTEDASSIFGSAINPIVT